jgi:hypothetical protein
MDRACGHCGKEQMQTGFRRRNLKGRYHLEGLDVEEKMILKWILNKYVWRVLTGFIWLKTGTRWQAVVNTVMNLWVL